ncbi:MAG: hypothetical protein IH586_11475 [Anaerolineaceae bacterium]|nr:hypothetical protein [Anaerolineaceae bacterium]
MKHEMAVLILWLLAVVPTLLLVHQTGVFTYLGPLYFICIVGSVYVVRSAKKKER